MEMLGVLVVARVVALAREKVALVVAPHLSTRNILSLLSPPKPKNVGAVRGAGRCQGRGTRQGEGGSGCGSTPFNQEYFTLLSPPKPKKCRMS